MAAAAVRTGHGATLTMATSGFVAAFRSIGSFEFTREDLETYHLRTVDYMTFQPGDLINPGEFTAEFLYDANSQPPFLGPPEVCTITLPGPGLSWAGGATIAGSGYVKQWTSPELVTNQIMMSSMVVKWSGTITFTDETP